MLPQLHNRNIAIFYLLTTLGNMVFFMGNWIFFWLRFMTYGQLGWIDAISFASGMLMEIPTGAISDLIGKKKTLIFAMALTSVGFFIMSPASDKIQILVGFIFAQVGWAFYSGAAEALAFDSLKEVNKEDDFDQVITKSSMLGLITLIISILVGTILYEWNFRAPHWAMAVANFVAFICTWFLTEPKVDTEKFSLKNYFKQLGQGFKQLWLPSLKRFLPLIFTLLGVYYMFNSGFVKPAMAEYFSLYAREQGFLLAALTLFAAILVRFIPLMRKKFTDAQGLMILTSLLGGGFLLVGVFTGWWGLISLMMIITAGCLAEPWVSVVVNRELDSKYRATTLSTIAMITKLPYILAAVAAGKLIEDGHIVQFNVGVGVFVSVIVLMSGFLLKEKLVGNFRRSPEQHQHIE